MRNKLELNSITLLCLFVTLLSTGCADRCPVNGTSCRTPGKTEGQNKTENPEKKREVVASTQNILIEVPDPLADDNPACPLTRQPVPEPGKPLKDARFGTILTRVTQKKGIRHEYSRFDPFNADQSMIILPDLVTGDRLIYRTARIPYEQKKNLARKVDDLGECRWDPADPNLVWGQRGFSIITLNVKTGKEKVIKDFRKDSGVGLIIKNESDLYRITMKDEGESSIDKRFWAFILQGSKDDYRPRYLFTWDRRQDTILGLYKIPRDEADLDWVGMSPKGTWALIGGMDSNKANLAGLTMANKELTRFHRLDFTTSHADVGLDSDGNEIVVMQNYQTDYIDLIPLDPKTKPILKSDETYRGTNRTPLVRLFYSSESPHSLNSGIHISANAPGYCVVSTHIEPGVKERNWLDRTIIMIKLDQNHPRVFYLAKVHNTTKAYWEETQATITNDGSKVVWAENWGQDVGKEKIWLMQLDMPDGWRDALR